MGSQNELGLLISAVSHFLSRQKYRLNIEADRLERRGKKYLKQVKSLRNDAGGREVDISNLNSGYRPSVIAAVSKIASTYPLPKSNWLIRLITNQVVERGWLRRTDRQILHERLARMRALLGAEEKNMTAGRKRGRSPPASRRSSVL